MMRLPVLAKDGSWISANIFIDEGSDSTLVQLAFRHRLNIRGARRILDVDGAGGVVNRYRSFQIQLHVRTESGEIVLLEGSTMKKVASSTPVTDLGEEEK